MGSEDGLGKFPVVIAVGDALTREQTNEVMLRTNRWHLSSNDEAWHDMVIHILGLADKLNASLRKTPWGMDWDPEYEWELTEAFGDGIKALKLFALDSSAITTYRRGTGWLDWSGRIHARYREGSKWTSINEVDADWRAIAAAFPFLRLRAQLAAGDYLNDLPAGTVGAEWIIEGGAATRVERPGKALIGPERWWHKHHGDWYQFPWWSWKIASPVTALYYWQRRRHEARWPHIGPWSIAMHWNERAVSAARLIEAVDQIREQYMPNEFTLTEQHLLLLGRLNWEWTESGKGAPAVDPKRPYGTSWIFHDIADILDPEGCPTDDEAAIERYEQEHEEAYDRLHTETVTALDIVLRTGALKPGRYRRTDPWAHDWTYTGPA